MDDGDSDDDEDEDEDEEGLTVNSMTHGYKALLKRNAELGSSPVICSSVYSPVVRSCKERADVCKLLCERMVRSSPVRSGLF